MKRKRIHALVIFGTRPEAIKLAPVIRELRENPRFRVSVCATAQHRQLLDQVTRLFRIRVNHDLDLMRPDQKLDQFTGQTIIRLSSTLKAMRPDVVVIQGDTTTAFVSALASFYQKIPVAHVEAGLRTLDRYSPFPEEMNRRLTSHLANYHFAPTKWAKQNLVREGVRGDQIFITGNTVVDVFLEAQRAVCRRPPEIPSLNGFDWTTRKLILVTAHRRENFGQRLEEICLALRQLALSREDIEIVYPVHPNPNVRGPVWQSIGGIPRIHLIEPLEYLQFVRLMSHAYLALTDSGGIQEEMPSLGRPVLVMREETERPEGIQAGVCKLVGTHTGTIVNTVTRLLEDECCYHQFGRHVNPFGDGQAAPRIVKHLTRVLK
jgi:UDP-N-acetylglucosamine 2-epimerase (non-hydrolysing)